MIRGQSNLTCEAKHYIMETGCDAKLLKEIDTETGLTVEDKMIYVENIVKQTRPFYYYLFCSLDKKFTVAPNLDKLGISLDTFYVNPVFVKDAPLPELVFLLFHEICHIAMEHVVRMYKRDAQIWNYATDYYVNKHLEQEFELPKDYTDTYIKVNNEKTEYLIRFPKGELNHPQVDLKNDTPESLYNELMEEIGKENQKKQEQEDQEQGTGQEQGEGKEQGEDKEQGEGKEQGEDKEQGEGNEQGEGKEQGEGNEQGEGQGTKESGLKNVMFRGEQLPELKSDMFLDKNSPTSYEQAKLKSQNTLKKAVTRTKMQIPTFGEDTASVFERKILESLAPKIDWRRLLQNKLITASQKINTFAAPDKRFISRGMIMPGPKALDPDTLENVKICIDTSGSVTDAAIGKIFNQINQLLKAYNKCKAEVLYWDTQVRAVFEFKNINELLKQKPLGGGGTDANCIFEYFETNRDYKIGIKKKPSIIIVFTDGCFGAINPKYKKYVDTLWVIDGDASRFKPPFGKVAPFMIDTDD